MACYTGREDEDFLDREDLRWRAKKKLAAGLHDSAVSLPGRQNSAGGKGSNVSRVGELLVRQFERSPRRGLAAKPMRKGNQNMSELLFSAVGHQAGGCCEVPRQIVCCDRQRIIKESRHLRGNSSDCATRPSQQATVTQDLSAHQILDRC